MRQSEALYGLPISPLGWHQTERCEMKIVLIYCMHSKDMNQALDMCARKAGFHRGRFPVHQADGNATRVMPKSV